MKEHGAILMDGKQVGTTLQCPHCGCHFLSIKGSGKRRAYCMKCSAVTCGAVGCDICIPLEAQLEYSEGTRTKYDEEIKNILNHI